MTRNIFLHLCSLIISLLWSVSVFSANTVKVELAEIANNGEATMNVVFSADEDFICFQTEVDLPDGMEAVMTDSRYAFLPDGIRATHQISSNLVGNTLKIVSFSADNSKYPRSGILFSFKIRPVEGFKGGNVTVDNTVFTTTDFRDVPFAATTTWLDAEMQAGNITLSQTNAQLKVGESLTLTAMVLPETTTDKTVTWGSSDETIATVDAEGKVTALTVGEATITASCGNSAATCTVNVVATPAESITLSQTSAQLKAGESIILTATVLPETTTNKTITWKSSDENVATVDKDGKVTAIAVGTATITATCGSVSASCSVTVVATPAESIALSQTTAQLKAGESIILTATVLPETTTNKTVTWKSSDEKVATMDKDGKVTAIAVGTATITATCGSVSATCIVSVVTTPAESITLSQTSAQLKAGESVILTATVLPETTTNKTVTWKSSNEKVATVDKDGKVTAIAVGTATITATCGNVSATCTVSVVATPAESITLSQTTAQLKAGESVTLTATVLPETTTNKTVTWSSSDETIATVDAEGKVTALAVGEATITATAADGSGVSASCQVTVLPILAESLTVTPESWTGEEGESFTLTATVLPENTTDKSVSWSSSNQEIATVDADGRVSVLKDDYCVITVSTLDGSELSAECIITCTSGIDELFTDADARFNVYNLHGILIKKDCGRDYLRSLSAGTYILRQGNVSRKMIIR